MRYYLALLLKYLSEQQSSQVNPSDEPAIGVDTYRTLLERFDIDSYTDSAFAISINRLPWYQTFYVFSYLDPARLDETSSETSLGNFWVACYLKDLGTRIPDRRFDFMEDEENATWDEIFLGSNTTSTLGGVTLTSTSTLNTGGTITLSSGAGGMVSPFAARFYKVNISSGVDTLKVDFTVGSGFTKPLVQVVLVEQGNRVRDILRTDKTGWSRTIANSRSGTNLDHILVVVGGTDVGGNFTLTVREVPPAPDIMVTRWHHSAGTHYEIDSFGWSWTWVSPDIFVDNDGNGLADDQVFFNTNNRLYIRLRNQGHVDASNISVSFWYQDASAGLSDSAWQPVKDSGGITQTLTGLTLAAGATDKWYVNWAPAPSGTSHHFCVKAVLTSLGDPNTDNKRCLSNFGNVITGSYFIDLELVLRFPKKFSSHRIDMIPRGDGKWFISAADLAHAEKLNAKAGQEIIEQFRIKRRAKLTAHTEDTKHILKENKLLAKMPCPKLPKRTRLECRPDVFGHYPTNPSALPPGLEKAAMITIAHIVDGRPLGGFTWAFREEKSHGIAKKKIGQGSRRRTDKKANLTNRRIRR